MKFDTLANYLIKRVENGNPETVTTKYNCKQNLIVFRALTRCLLSMLYESREKTRALCRSIRIMESQSTSFPLVNSSLKSERARQGSLMFPVATLAQGIMGALDIWQSTGATLKDLCNLCSRDYSQVINEIREEDRDRPFSEVVLMYDIDCKDDKHVILEDSVDAPFTNILREYIRYEIISNPEARQAAREAINACVPELFDTAIHIPDSVSASNL